MDCVSMKRVNCPLVQFTGHNRACLENKKKTLWKSRKSFRRSGDKEIRTLDPLLAKQVLYQLSYTPKEVGTRGVEPRTSTLSV